MSTSSGASTSEICSGEFSTTEKANADCPARRAGCRRSSRPRCPRWRPPPDPRTPGEMFSACIAGSSAATNHSETNAARTLAPPGSRPRATPASAVLRAAAAECPRPAGLRRRDARQRQGEEPQQQHRHDDRQHVLVIACGRMDPERQRRDRQCRDREQHQHRDGPRAFRTQLLGAVAQPRPRMPGPSTSTRLARSNHQVRRAPRRPDPL